MTAKSRKPKIAFFDFTSCEGCQLTVVDRYKPTRSCCRLLRSSNFAKR